MYTHYKKLTMFGVLLFSLQACGGGGSSGSKNESGESPTPPQINVESIVVMGDLSEDAIVTVNNEVDEDAAAQSFEVTFVDPVPTAYIVDADDGVNTTTVHVEVIIEDPQIDLD